MELKAGYKQSDLGVIPQEWEVVEIGDLRPFVTSGSRGWASFYSDRGSLFVRITNLSRDSIYLDLEDSKFVNLPPEAREGTRTQLVEHDVLISITADIGIIGYVDSGVPMPAYINQHVALVRFDPSKASGKFVSYFLASERPQKLFRASTDVGAKAGMSLMTVQKIQLALPSLPEQRAIAAALSDVDALIGTLDLFIAKKRDVKQAAMQQLLTGQCRLPGFGDGHACRPTSAAQLPADWVLMPLKSISSMSGRIGWQGLKQEEFTSVESDPFLITGMNFHDGRIRWDEVYHIPHERYDEAKPIQLRSGDILMTKDGTIGKLLFVENIPFPGKASLNSHLLVFRPVDESYIPKLLFYQLSSKRFADYVDLNKSGTTFFGITQEAVGNYPAYLPSIGEQAAIAAVLSDIDIEIAALERRRDKTRALKQGMMQELLTGRTRLV